MANITIPYWDNTIEQALQDPRQSILFSPLFMGTANGQVTTGRKKSNMYYECIMRLVTISGLSKGHFEDVTDVSVIAPHKVWQESTWLAV